MARGDVAVDEPTAEAAAPDREAIVLTYRIDAALLYEAMVAMGRAMMARREPTDGGRSGWRALRFMIAGLIGLAALIDLIAWTSGEFEFVFMMIGLVLGLAFYTMFLNRSYRRMSRMMAANPMHAGPHTATLGPDGIEIRGAASESRLGWETVEGVLHLNRGIVLMVPSELLPLPDEGLPRGMDRAALVSRIEQWRRAAGDGSAG